MWKDGPRFPNPALEDTLIHRHSIIGDPIVEDAQANRCRRKALVPGCGRGVDVLLIASFGYNAYVEEARTSDLYLSNQAVGRGSITFVQAMRSSLDRQFFCALSPSLRPEWALRQTQLLASNGHLICLEYPRHRDASEMGPPWAVSSEDYREHLTHAGEKNSGPQQQIRMVPDRTHENGRDANGIVQDRVAIWHRCDEGHRKRY
ncbi:hypothetical protein BDV29DRAFT_188633 [Aspergillus leporis]|uniref:S-adenosyl-L-methionine-dependent methyltransferase n=1 Tax=Aspergillus leporis TaxID=41062 RepID=A0A5N5XBR9_9EURO|nr:hypothetical protein BDV29DRAFT_188633 [Aspergillus leporis]